LRQCIVEFQQIPERSTLIEEEEGEVQSADFPIQLTDFWRLFIPPGQNRIY
jgi:hypothetical protein